MKKVAFVLSFCAMFGVVVAQSADSIAADEPVSVQAAQDTLAAAQTEPQPYCKYKIATYGQAKAMAFLLKREASDSQRLKLGKKYIANYLLTAEQLGWLADTFSDVAKRTKFLKKAQKHCSEPSDSCNAQAANSEAAQ